MAQANFVQGGLNRVILCTDGDLNFGGAPATTLGRMVTEKAKSGLALTVMDVGSGGANESMMRKLAERGSGVYGYADTRQAAEKFLATQVEGSPAMVAKAVRLQVEFNPANVASYRLIGYEKRVAKDADLPNDKLGGGEVTAGQSVTALYEVVLLTMEQIAERKKEAPELRYVAFGGTSLQIQSSHGDLAREMLTVRVRYKDPDGFFSKKQEFPIVDERHRFADASEDFKFAAAVAGFGMVLKDSKYKGSATFASVAEWANAGRAYDPGGYRADFVSLVQRAKGLL
jgi:Ca-activated chloride channel family protein